MSTRELARKYNAVEIINIDKSAQTENLSFDYLLVVDFEATCWKNKKLPWEIIEFPCVLFDLREQEILDEFQQYVKPTENPILSEFCKNLTGIQQEQVDNGVTLQKCLILFRQWLDRVVDEYNMGFPDDPQKQNQCVFATWSDWDFNVCLKNECKRKHILYHNIYRKWLDVREIYKNNYRRPINGLRGALSDFGLEFEGNEHCGLHDARNTAKLAGKMISDGAVLKLATIN